MRLLTKGGGLNLLGLFALFISAQFPLSVFWHDAFFSHVSQDRVTAAATSAPPPLLYTSIRLFVEGAGFLYCIIVFMFPFCPVFSHDIFSIFLRHA